MSKVSVIVPVYSVEKYLNRCVESIINQTYKNMEIILVDDGSPDRCGKICDDYAGKDSRIKVIHKKNGGLSDARNAGINSATGDYLMFVDSDDYIAPDMIEIMYNRLTADKSDMAICNFWCVDEMGDAFSDKNKELPIIDEIVNRVQALEKLSTEKYWYYVTAWNKLYKKELFNEIRFPVGKQHEDEFTVHHLLGSCNKVLCISSALYYYVQRDGSIMNQKYSVKRLDAAEAFIDRAEYLFDCKLNKLAIDALCRVVSTVAYGFSKIEEDPAGIKKRIKELKKKIVSISAKKIAAILNKASLKELLKLTLFIVNLNLYRFIITCRIKK